MALRQNSDKEPSIELFIKVSLFFSISLIARKRKSIATCEGNAQKNT